MDKARWEVSINELPGPIKRINPNDCILRIECLERRFKWDFILSIELLKLASYPILSFTMFTIKKVSGDEVSDIWCDLSWFCGWGDILEAYRRFFSYYT